jgi:HSP20 family protein
MKLAKRDPFRDVDEFFGRPHWALDLPFRGGRELSGSRFDWSPRVDVRETKDDFQIDAEIPGIKREEVEINVDNHVLTIQGETKREKKEEDEEYHRVERYYGSFSRSFSLPENVDEEKIEASFKDGLLTLTVPKTEKAKPKKIEVKVQ